MAGEEESQTRTFNFLSDQCIAMSVMFMNIMQSKNDDEGDEDNIQS